MDRNSCLITVFTPTYNRAHTLSQLYESLCSQTCREFEWLIIDDGSVDDTESVVRKYMTDNRIHLRYFKVTNGGKHRAINSGVQLAYGELFFIVDSDDYLDKNAVKILKEEFQKIRYKESFCGICGLKADTSGTKIGGEESWRTLKCSPLDLRYKYKVKGDMAEVFLTSILKESPFPEIEGEKFCPEALLWNRLSKKYKMYYFYRKIYFCEYLPDGLTSKIIKIRRDSPTASRMYYSELASLKIPFLQKIKAAVNYWRFYPDKIIHDGISINCGLSLIGIIPGRLMRLKDNRKV